MSIDGCLDLLKSGLDTALAAVADKTYDYRTFPDKLPRTVSLSYQGGNPSETPTMEGDYGYYDVTAVIGAQIDVEDSDPEAALRAADRALNALEDGIYGHLAKGGAGYRTDLWMRVSFPQPSRRPPSFIEAPSTRYGEIPFRLHLK